MVSLANPVAVDYGVSFAASKCDSLRVMLSQWL